MAAKKNLRQDASALGFEPAFSFLFKFCLHVVNFYQTYGGKNLFHGRQWRIMGESGEFWEKVGYFGRKWGIWGESGEFSLYLSLFLIVHFHESSGAARKMFFLL